MLLSICIRNGVKLYSMDSNNNELNTKNESQDKSIENRAVISMVLGIASIVGSFFVGPIALICGIIAMVMAFKIQKNNGFAKAGFITGLVGTILTTLILIFTIFILMAGKNIFNKYFGKTINRLFDIVENAAKEQIEDGNDQEDENMDEESIQKDSELEEKKEKLDELKKEVNSLNDEILTVKDSGDVAKLSELQQKLFELTEKVIELESEIFELED